MVYGGKVDADVFRGLNLLLARFEKALTRYSELTAGRNICNYGKGSRVVFYSDDVFTGEVIFSENGVAVVVGLNGEDPVAALVKYSGDPGRYWDALERAFERVVQEYMAMAEKMRRVLE